MILRTLTNIMCQKCVITEPISSKSTIVHIGYGKNNKNKYDKLIEDDIVIETSKSKKKLSQEDYFKLWDKLKNKDTFGNIDPDLPQKNNSACAVCGEYLITVPAINAECYVDDCRNTKHGKIKSIKENEDEIRKQMEEYFGPEGAGHGKQNEPIELAIRAGLHCPNNHWVCAECLTSNRSGLIK